MSLFRQGLVALDPESVFRGLMWLAGLCAMALGISVAWRLYRNWSVWPAKERQRALLVIMMLLVMEAGCLILAMWRVP